MYIKFFCFLQKKCWALRFQADNVYSSLYKNLNSIIPGSKPPQDDDGAANGFADETAQIDESRTEIIYETDEGKVAEYNEWYTSFYGRPSPYPPTELPVPLPPPPNLSSALSIAARYVAMNGGAAEQRLIGLCEKIYFLQVFIT